MKKLLMLLGIVAMLLVVVFFVVTSSGFLKSVVLPRVGAAIDAKVDAESIALSPFSGVEIRKLSVLPNGAEPLVTVDVARVRYKLAAILGGRIEVDEIFVGTPAVSLVQRADGTSNLDPILKKVSQPTGASTPPPASPPGPAKAPQIDLKSIVVENASFTYRATGKDGAKTSADVTALGVKLAGLKNGGKGQITVGSGFSFGLVSGGPGAEESRLQGNLKGQFDLELGPELAPGGLAGSLTSVLQQTSGAFKDFQGFGAALNADMGTSELRKASLEFTRQGTALGAITAKGPLDLAKKEARLQVDVSSIDRNVLNLVGAGMGLDFATTRFDSANQITLGAGGNAVAIVGSLTGSKVSVKKGDLVVPALDIKKTYDLSADLAAQSLNLKSFALTTVQGGRQVLRGSLAQPMQLSWAPNGGALPDARLEVAVTDLRFQDWSALVGTPIQGSLNATSSVGVQGGGKDLGFAVAAQLVGLSGAFGSNTVRNLGAQTSVEGTVASFADPARRRLVVASKVSDLTGEAAVVKFERFGLEAKADLGLPEGAVALDDVQLKLREGARESGQIGLKGRWNLETGGGDLALSAKGLDEAALRPFLQAALGNKQLRSVQLSADLGARVDPKGESSIKATANVTNLVVKDPSGTVPETPLALGLNLDGSGTQQRIVLRQAGLKLTPTARARNELGLSGELDFSKPDALKGGFKFTAESVDVTPYFDLFAGGTSGATNSAGTPAPSTPPPPAGPQKEPDPVRLPVELLTFDARVGKFFLREIAAENFTATVKIQSTRIDVQPFQLGLNGAPIKAGVGLNLGVPGYEYDVNFSAGDVPVRPFANSFVPMLKDRIEGTIKSGGEIKGAGVTGTSLRKSLQGSLNLAVTNANLKLTPAAGQRPGILSMLTGLLATALNIRELKEQPIMELVGTIKMGGGKIDLARAMVRSASLEAGTSGSVPIADDLMKSPLDLPVEIALFRELAERTKLVPPGTPTNAAYVSIPPIASIKGTLGAPEAEVDKLKAGLLAARGIAGLVGTEAGNAVGGVADLVGNVAKGGTNAVGNLIQGLGGLFGGKPSPTNAPGPAAGANNASKASAPPTNSPVNAVGNLLRGLIPRKRD